MCSVLRGHLGTRSRLPISSWRGQWWSTVSALQEWDNWVQTLAEIATNAERALLHLSVILPTYICLTTTDHYMWCLLHEVTCTNYALNVLNACMFTWNMGGTHYSLEFLLCSACDLTKYQTKQYSESYTLLPPPLPPSAALSLAVALLWCLLLSIAVRLALPAHFIFNSVHC